jgi:tRNA-modifying protein YgfZ
MMELVDTKKGCYIGQEVIARLETYDKVQRTIMGVRLSQEEMPAELNLVDENGAEAGNMTSVVHSRKCKCIIGLAYIRKAYAEDGRELYVKGSSSKVIVKSLPFRR